MSDLITIEQSDAVTRLTLNRPEKHNAMSTDMMNGLTQGLTDLNTPVAVIAASGDKTFCAGADLGEMRLGADAAAGQTKALRDLMKALARSPALIISLPFGRVMGGGGLLTILSDIVLMRDDTCLSFPEIQFKMFPSAIYAALLERVSPSMAWQLCASGVTLNANQAFAQSLATRVIPAGNFASDCEGLVNWYSDRAEVLCKAKADALVIDADRIFGRPCMEQTIVASDPSP